ncbi:MAG TPA: hypothetical protein DCQ32_11720 [Cyanobacteria bacterium UBA8156]|jgi:hypothetical protein|nr:hypothetical protein [Cyanobacteria bacterium UBA8156]
MTAPKTPKVEPSPNISASSSASTATVDVTPAATTNPAEGSSTNASALQVRTESDSAIVSTFRVAGDRPVYASQLAISETYSIAGSIRPIQASRQHVVEMMGDRPIMASGLDIGSTFQSSGLRPISAASLVISESYRSMGDRPVASNEIDNPVLLMGFLD